jgi:predicted RNA-binding protein with PUA-like domain
MYVEEVGVEIDCDDQDIWPGDDEGGDESAADDMGAHDIESPKMQSPAQASDKGKGVAEEEDQDDEEDDLEENISDSSFDEDYQQPAEDDSSADDEEANELRNYARLVKRNIRAKKLGIHGSQVGNIAAEDLFDEVPNLDDPGSPYVDSSEEYSYDENSDCETERWKSLENRFDSKAEVPIFSLGMAFRDSRQFKKALVKYGLKAHRSLRFPKDEKTKVRAECDWPGCQWSIYGSITTRSKWFKVVTFNDVHSCPPTKENKLVTSTLIAKHYYQQIKDNPTWKVALIKAVVQKDLFADVSISKCKRAKSLVLQKAQDAMKGEYSRV